MTAIPFENPNAGTDANPQVWRCASCHCVHLHVGQVLLTFTQSEFAGFAQEVAECYCVQMQPGNLSNEHPHERALANLLVDQAALANVR